MIEISYVMAFAQPMIVGPMFCFIQRLDSEETKVNLILHQSSSENSDEAVLLVLGFLPGILVIFIILGYFSEGLDLSDEPCFQLNWCDIHIHFMVGTLGLMMFVFVT